MSEPETEKEKEEKLEAQLRESARAGLRFLLIQRRSQPGCKGWELKRELGRNYLQILRLVNGMASDIGLKLVSVPDEDFPDDPDRSRYLLVSKEPLSEKDTGSWLRMEEAASLAIILSHLFVKGEVDSKAVVMTMVREKLPSWRAQQVVSKLTRLGYLEDDAGYIRVGWRTKVEIDRDELLTSILSRRPEGGDPANPST
ncbi:MAG: hypothetical protein JRN68_04230 [Nitrososphaerota archaeon]|jgi:hypothetical protein|nr:hypothetical protein [Nitrososphaerota archaeon]